MTTENAPYTLEAANLLSITDLEAAFGTTRLLPAWDAIPAPFKHHNDYSRIAEAIFQGNPVPDMNIAFNAGFSSPDVLPALHKCVRAHLISFEPKHQHKIAGVAFMMSQVFTIVAERNPA